jgi:transcriptional regulator with XRE-family HTH domain
MITGSILRLYRSICGYNQKFIANVVGLSERQWNNIENEVTPNVSQNTLQLAAAALNIPIETIKVGIIMVVNIKANVITELPADTPSVNAMVLRIEILEKVHNMQ